MGECFTQEIFVIWFLKSAKNIHTTSLVRRNKENSLQSAASAGIKLMQAFLLNKQLH